MNEIKQKYATLLDIYREQSGAIIAFSGGIDSTFALKAAIDALGSERVLAITAVSAAVPAREREEAAQLADELGARHRFVDSNEIERPGYAANGFDRCFHCKSELYEILKHVAAQEDQRFIANGANVDDLGDHRPGQTAAAQNGVRSPLIEAGFSKAEIRELAREFGLRIWDKPASPCLSSRIPYNTPVTVKKLNQVESAEQILRDLGLREFRVRHHERIARIEARAEDMPKLLVESTRAKIVAGFRELGFLYVSLDLGGFQSGNLNREVPAGERSSGRKDSGL
ncbi:MAG: ATP-dependent sacrificial sulfur transferase LarE [bacterium]|nr:ATP-dependent sacrificial sulfur transferase LarE [bacterium]